MKNSENLNFIIIGPFKRHYLLFKRFVISPWKTDRIPLILSIWTPIIALSFFT